MSLLSLLAPQSPSMYRVGRNIYSVTPSDVAQACGNTSSISWQIISIKYMGDNVCIPSLVKLLHQRLQGEIVSEDWDDQYILPLLKLAVTEYCGCYKMTGRSRAAFMNMHPSKWSRAWKTRYMRVLEVLEYSEQSAEHKVKVMMRY